MNKRARVSKFVFFGVLLVVMIAFSIVGFIVPAYSSVFTSLLYKWFRLFGAYQLFTGIKQMQKAKAQGEHVPWWKQPSIMSGSAYEGTAAIGLWTNLTPNWSNNVFFTSMYFLMFLLSLSLLIYGFNLIFQQAATEKRLNQPQKNE